MSHRRWKLIAVIYAVMAISFIAILSIPIPLLFSSLLAWNLKAPEWSGHPEKPTPGEF